jgi:hypothetical protein
VVKDKKEKTIATGTETKVVFGIYIQPYNLVISIQLFQLRLSPEQSGKVEYERERLLEIANK